MDRLSLRLINGFAFGLFFVWALGAARNGEGFLMVWNTGFCIYFAREMIFA